MNSISRDKIIIFNVQKLHFLHKPLILIACKWNLCFNTSWVLPKTALRGCLGTADCQAVLQLSIWHYKLFQCSHSNPESQCNIRNIIWIFLVRTCWMLCIFQGFRPTLSKNSHSPISIWGSCAQAFTSEEHRLSAPLKWGYTCRNS